MTINNFDKIAQIYDILTQIIFGSSIQIAQLHFLPEIKPNSTILILGGGSGWFLKEVLDHQPACRVCYIEASEKMLQQSKRITECDSRVKFIHGTENNIPNQQFDYVITNFYLDLFTTTTLKTVIVKIKRATKPSSQWFVTDFVDSGKWWQQKLLSLMYLFFKLTCHIEAQQLADWNLLLKQNGWNKKYCSFYYHKFIHSCVYKS